MKNLLKLIVKNDGVLLIVDYGYFQEQMKNTLQSIYKQKYSNVLENIGKSDITHSINFFLFDKIRQNFKELDSNFTTQKNFLTNLGIKQRAEIICKCKTFKEKADIYYRLERLVGEKEMGNLFKVMMIKNSYNTFKLGF